MSGSEKSRRVADDMAARLRAGWTLTSRLCPVPGCNTALVRNKEGAFFCAGCSMPVRLESELKAGSYTPAAAAPASPAPAKPVAQVDPEMDALAAAEEAAAAQQQHRRAVGGLASLADSPHFAQVQAQLAERATTTTTEGTEEDGALEGAEEEEETPEERERIRAAMEARRLRSDGVSKALAAKLQAGWALLADLCPDPQCGCPMMKDKEGQRHCVACEASPTGSRGAGAGGKPEPANATVAAAPSVSTSPSPSPSSSTAAAAAAGPKKEKERTAPGSPARRSHNRFEAPDDDGVKAAGADRIAKSDEVSKRLGEKLLAGWALLEQACPNPQCDCPLMRDRQGTMHCVSCGSVVVHEKDYDPAKHGPAANLDSSPASSPAATAARGSASATRSPVRSAGAGERASLSHKRTGGELSPSPEDEERHKRARKETRPPFILDPTAGAAQYEEEEEEGDEQQGGDTQEEEEDAPRRLGWVGRGHGGSSSAAASAASRRSPGRRHHRGTTAPPNTAVSQHQQQHQQQRLRPRYAGLEDWPAALREGTISPPRVLAASSSLVPSTPLFPATRPNTAAGSSRAHRRYGSLPGSGSASSGGFVAQTPPPTPLLGPTLSHPAYRAALSSTLAPIAEPVSVTATAASTPTAAGGLAFSSSFHHAMFPGSGSGMARSRSGSVQQQGPAAAAAAAMEAEAFQPRVIHAESVQMQQQQQGAPLPDVGSALTSALAELHRHLVLTSAYLAEAQSPQRVRELAQTLGDISEAIAKTAAAARALGV